MTGTVVCTEISYRKLSPSLEATTVTARRRRRSLNRAATGAHTTQRRNVDDGTVVCTEVSYRTLDNEDHSGCVTSFHSLLLCLHRGRRLLCPHSHLGRRRCLSLSLSRRLRAPAITSNLPETPLKKPQASVRVRCCTHAGASPPAASIFAFCISSFHSGSLISPFASFARISLNAARFA